MNFKKILVPLDQSELAERALTPALHIAEGMSAEIVLLHVVVPLELDLVLYESSLRHGEEMAEAYLAFIRTRFVDAQPDMTAKVIVSSVVPTAVINYAQGSDVDLIVMSSHGRSGLSRWRYGSVAAKVLRQAPCAMLVIPAETETELFTFGRILVPLDGSEMAEQALEPAMAIARAAAAELVLLRVVALPYIAVEFLSTERNIEQIEAEASREASAYLQHLKESLAGEHHILIRTETIIGPAADAISDYVNENNVDIIVMSSHGRSGILLWTYGSVAEKVLLGTDCATMIIRH
ncbi:MAG: universal stress protein [Candidatus Promineifilaceae bacterium]